MWRIHFGTFFLQSFDVFRTASFGLLGESDAWVGGSKSGKISDKLVLTRHGFVFRDFHAFILKLTEIVLECWLFQ
jgi:hypothetical protein